MSLLTYAQAPLSMLSWASMCLCLHMPKCPCQCCREMSALEGRVRELEVVNQALQSNTTDATRPLLRWVPVVGLPGNAPWSSCLEGHSSHELQPHGSWRHFG